MVRVEESLLRPESLHLVMSKDVFVYVFVYMVEMRVEWAHNI